MLNSEICSSFCNLETSKEINGKTKGNATGQFEGKDLEENVCFVNSLYISF